MTCLQRRRPGSLERGFSDQVNVPQVLHQEVIGELLAEYRDRLWRTKTVPEKVMQEERWR